MWQCQKCRERIEDSFEFCWNCGTSRDGVEDPTFVRDQGDGREPTSQPDRQAPGRTIDQLIFVGLNGYALALDRDTGEIV